MDIKQIHGPALPVRETFLGFKFRYLSEDSCMDAPLWIPAGGCRRKETEVTAGYKVSRPLQIEHRRHEWW
jgi:hypothetical protein